MQGSYGEGKISVREKRRRRAAATQLIYRIKLEKATCEDCRQPFPPKMLDFDHCHGPKKFNISRARDLPQRVLLREIAKCDIVCPNCHRMREIEREVGRKTLRF